MSVKISQDCFMYYHFKRYNKFFVFLKAELSNPQLLICTGVNSAKNVRVCHKERFLLCTVAL